MNSRNRIYLDHSATTPADPQVVEAMMPYFNQCFGNASSIHAFGQDAKVALEESRRQIARLLDAEPSEIVFTSGGTEADNWAIRGGSAHYDHRRKHIITSKVEHHAVLHTCQVLAKEGFEVTYLKTDKTGATNPEDVSRALREDTCLVSLIHGNNEIGTLNEISEIGKITRERGVLFHTDAVQSAGKIPVDVKSLNVDLLSLSAHKIYGPKGIGALYIRRGIRLAKLLEGGKHERDRRAGTENVPAAVGFGKAAQLCSERMTGDSARISELRALLRKGIEERLDGVYLNGSSSHFLPGILNMSFEGVESDSLLLSLDLEGVAVSNGSACTSGSVEPSHVLEAIGRPKELARSALRFSLGRQNTLAEVQQTLGIVEQVVKRLRRLKKRF